MKSGEKLLSVYKAEQSSEVRIGDNKAHIQSEAHALIHAISHFRVKRAKTKLVCLGEQVQ